MEFLKEVFSADGLTKAAGLGAGDMAAKALVFQGNKFITDAKVKAGDKPNEILNIVEKALPVAPALLGVYLSTRKETLSRAIGNGMIANSIGGLIGGLIDKENKFGIGSVFIAGPSYQYSGADAEFKQGAKQPFMAGTSNFSNGEMNY